MNDIFPPPPLHTSPAAAEHSHRLFFALRPEAGATEAISRLTAKVRARQRIAAPAVARERLHVSLNFLGRFAGPPPGEVVAGACRAVAAVAMPPFVVRLNRVESWKGGAGARPLVLVGDEGVIGIEMLHGAIHGALAAAGLAGAREPDRWAHLTLLWGRHDLAETLREPVSWTVREFVLLDSPFGESRHEMLGRWPLAA